MRDVGVKTEEILEGINSNGKLQVGLHHLMRQVETYELENQYLRHRLTGRNSAISNQTIKDPDYGPVYFD